MKKLSLMFLLLVAGLYFTACGDDSDVPANGYIETTEEGSATYVLKGYEDASDGFNVFEGEGFEKSFYILEKKFTGSAWSFVKAASGPLSAMAEIPADNVWQVDMDVVEGANYWARKSFSIGFGIFTVSTLHCTGEVGKQLIQRAALHYIHLIISTFTRRASPLLHLLFQIHPVLLVE